MKVIIDRFEGDYAVVESEDGHRANMARILLPMAREGDVVGITLLPRETAKRKKAINQLAQELWRD